MRWFQHLSQHVTVDERLEEIHNHKHLLFRTIERCRCRNDTFKIETTWPFVSPGLHLQTRTRGVIDTLLRLHGKFPWQISSLHRNVRPTWLVPPQATVLPRRWRSSTSSKPLLSSFHVVHARFVSLLRPCASFHGFMSWSPNHSWKTWREFSRRRSRPSHRRDKRALARRTGRAVGARTLCPRLRGRCAKKANRETREERKERTHWPRCSGRS